MTVLFGGARALLLQAAHPLVIAGARQTGFYERNPWKRLDRTLRLAYAITFAPEPEARAAAKRINDVHETVHGIDEVTGKTYDALDPDLLLWVHASLVDSALLYEQLTVGALDPAGRQRFHEEQMLAAEALLLPRDRIPATVPELRAYMAETIANGDTQVTDSALDLAGLFRNLPPEAEWRPVLRAVAWWGFATLPAPVREAYGVRWSPARQALLRANFAAVRAMRPLLPAKVRFIEPYNAWREHRPANYAVPVARV